MMDSELYRKWLEDIDALSPARRAEVRSLLAGRSSEAEVIAALERRVMGGRSGATVSAILTTISAGAIAAVLAPVPDKDALLVTDGATAFAPYARQLGVTHEALNQSAGERVRGALHIQTVNSRHERFKDLLRRHRGIAT